eukprot:PhM_4_TR9491/c13_g1_i1/m.26011
MSTTTTITTTTNITHVLNLVAESQNRSYEWLSIHMENTRRIVAAVITLIRMSNNNNNNNKTKSVFDNDMCALLPIVLPHAMSEIRSYCQHALVTQQDGKNNNNNNNKSPSSNDAALRVAITYVEQYVDAILNVENNNNNNN